MKPRLSTTLLFLLAGAMVNVAAAWSIWFWKGHPAWWPQPVGWNAYGLMEVASRESINDLWQRHAEEDWPAKPAFGREFRSRCATQLQLRSQEAWIPLTSPQRLPRLDLSRTHEAQYSSYGWPMRAMFLEVWGSGGDSRTTPYRSNGIRLPTADPDYLPIRPLGVGFTVNTLLYAVVLWLFLFAAPRTVLRQLRRKRGRCLECGYDLRGDLDAGCPECGWNRESSEGSPS
jgi:hypothetical protein